ncbi:MAG TPA: YqgE/AlgH family protein [Alphaproteobacteria bacterium]|nr:YqgE/AlgH family protein [Alphaproteobacteria bacterium]
MTEETKSKQEFSGYLTGQFLLAMPHLQDPRYEKTVIYICGHDTNGAMGLVVNKHLGDLTLKGLLEYLNLPQESIRRDLPIYFGGPVDTGRGFVLHSDDFTHPGTVPLGNHIALTATVDVLQAIAEGNGPKECLLAMGYVGWGPGQLDSELHSNRWLQVEADSEILFQTSIEKKWEKAIAKLGVTPESLSDELGQA